MKVVVSARWVEEIWPTVEGGWRGMKTAALTVFSTRGPDVGRPTSESKVVNLLPALAIRRWRLCCRALGSDRVVAHGVAWASWTETSEVQNALLSHGVVVVVARGGPRRSYRRCTAI